MLAGLSDQQLIQLLEAGEVMAAKTGTELFTEGQPAEQWWVLIDGEIALHRRQGQREEIVARMNVPGRWAGGFRAWDEHGTYLATGRVVVPGRVLRVPSERLRELTDEWFPFGGHLLRGVLGWGLSAALVYSLVMWAATGANLRLLLPASMVIFPIGGVLWGAAMWWFLERRYQREARLEATAEEE